MHPDEAVQLAIQDLHRRALPHPARLTFYSPPARAGIFHALRRSLAAWWPHAPAADLPQPVVADPRRCA